MKRGWASIVIIVLATLVGAAIGLAVGEYGWVARRWTSIGPRGVEVVDMQTYQGPWAPASYDFLYALMVRTDDGRLLSTGLLQGPVHGWEWTDISGGYTWSGFPEVGSLLTAPQGLELYIHHEGRVYRVDASGQWQPAEPPSGEVLFGSYTDVSTSRLYIAKVRELTPPEGDLIRLQHADVGFEKPIYFFALVRGKGVLLYPWEPDLRLPGIKFVGPLVGALFGFWAGWILANRLKSSSRHLEAQ